MKQPTVRMVVALAGLLLAGTVAAQATPPSEEAPQRSEGWHFQVTPYVWGIGSHGSLDVGPSVIPRVHFRQSFSDILKDLDGALFITGTARRDRWMLAFDYSWSSQSANHELIDLLSVHSRLRLSTGTLTAGYTVVHRDDLLLDLGAGARLWDISASLDASVLNLGVRKREAWVDPVVGVRVRWQISPDWSMSSYADVGRGVFGHGSKLTWQYMVAANYRLNDAWSVSIGYRRLGVDYRRNGIDLDLTLSGPLLGVTYRF